MLSLRPRLFALLGDPVAHSLSPRFQNAGFRAAGLDAVYVGLRVAQPDIAVMMHTVVASGGGGNITVPHKATAGLVNGTRSERVTRLGVANVFGQGPEGVALDNTDVDGILAALDRLGARNSDWCVLGSGGSARAVIGAALERGARIAVRSRTPERAAELMTWAERLGVALAEPTECQVVINTTPLGLNAFDALPATPGEFPRAEVALDLTYRLQGTTAWCEAFRAAGCQAEDGREVLLQQGAASWRLWFPKIAPPVEVMRAALNGHMG